MTDANAELIRAMAESKARAVAKSRASSKSRAKLRSLIKTGKFRLKAGNIARNTLTTNVIDEAFVNRMADLWEAHDYSDLYIALVCVGIDMTHDLEEAIDLANAIYEEDPEGPEGGA